MSKQLFIMTLRFISIVMLLLISWSGTYLHSTIGGVHGKFGFLFIITVISHIAKHKRFYYR